MSERPIKRGPYRTRQATEQLLLDAGLELLENGHGSGAYSLVTAKDVAKSAGMSTGAIYSRWDTLENFHRDLLLYQLTRKESPSPIDFMELFAGVSNGEVKGSEIIREIGPQELDFQRNNPAWGPVLVAWVLRADEAIRDAVTARYRNVRDANDALVEQSMHYAGRKLRIGLTARDLAVAMTALVDGLALRSRIDSDLVDSAIKWPPEAKVPIDWSLVAVGGDCLITYFTEPIEGSDLRQYWQEPSK